MKSPKQVKVKMTGLNGCFERDLATNFNGLGGLDGLEAEPADLEAAFFASTLLLLKQTSKQGQVRSTVFSSFTCAPL